MKTLETDHRREKPFSLLAADQVFVNKILARNSSFSRSSRRLSCKISSQVPFKWEIQPGKAKNPTQESTSTFPAVHSPPSIPIEESIEPKVSSSRKRVSFWKKYSMKSLKSRKDERSCGVCFEDCGKVLQNPSFSNLDDDFFTSSSSNSTSASGSSSSTSSAVTVPQRSSKIKSLAKGIIRYVF